MAAAAAGSRSEAREAPDVGEDLALERREWRIERIGWAAMLGFLIAAASGLLGAGPLAETRAATPDGALAVDYDRIVRRAAPTRLRVALRAAGGDREIRLWLARDLLERVDVEAVDPPPARTIVAPDRTLYVFAGTGEGLRVAIELAPRRIGRQPVALGVVAPDRAADLTFDQYVLP